MDGANCWVKLVRSCGKNAPLFSTHALISTFKHQIKSGKMSFQHLIFIGQGQKHFSCYDAKWQTRDSDRDWWLTSAVMWSRGGVSDYFSPANSCVRVARRRSSLDDAQKGDPSADVASVQWLIFMLRLPAGCADALPGAHWDLRTLTPTLYPFTHAADATRAPRFVRRAQGQRRRNSGRCVPAGIPGAS